MAIKVLKESASREVEEDFFREVDIMSAFRHENILFLLGVVQGKLFIAIKQMLLINSVAVIPFNPKLLSKNS